MPAMNGWEFLCRFNELPITNKENVIIIMLTTSLNPDDKIKAINIHGVSGFYPKPLTKELLTLVINKYCTSSFDVHHMKNPVP